MNYIDWCKEFFEKHPGTSIGLGIGVVLGLSFSSFGFWRTIVVALCVVAGLFIGWQVDMGHGFDLSGLKERWKGIRRK